MPHPRQMKGFLLNLEWMNDRVRWVDGWVGGWVGGWERFAYPQGRQTSDRRAKATLKLLARVIMFQELAQRETWGGWVGG